MNDVKNHPLYPADRENIDRLSAINSPASVDFVELARLIIRYQDFNDSEDLNADMAKILKRWKLNKEKLDEITRKIWSEGFRPNNSSSPDNVGSGFDTSDSSSS